MYEQEKQRATHLLVLLCYTISTIVLTAEALLLGWEIGAVILLLLGVLVSWGIHISEKIPESISLWLYFVQTMLAFFFYGTHETRTSDLAPVMLPIILTAGPIYDFMVGVLLGSTTFAFVNGTKANIKSKK